MNLETMIEIFWLVSRLGPSPNSEPTGCLGGGIITNQTINDRICSQFNSILPVIFALVSILVLLRILSLLMDRPESSSSTHRDDTDDDDNGFVHRLFYRKKKKRKEDGDSQE